MNPLRAQAVALALLCAAALSAAGQPPAEGHLLAGAAAFQKDRFDVALIEFRIALALGAPEAAWYVGAALQKLGRADDSVEEFQNASKTFPAAEDALLDFYFALACYDAKLYRAADKLLTKTGRQAGPRVAAEAQRTREQLAPIFRETPSTIAIDWYLQRAQQLIESGHVSLASLFLDEAIGLGERRSDKYGVSQAQSSLSQITGTPSDTRGRRR